MIQRSWSTQRKTLTDADYAGDLAKLANTPDQAETLLHSFGTSTRRHRPLC